MFQEKGVEKINRHAVYEIMSKNVVKRDRPQMTVWCVRFVPDSWDYRNTHGIFSTYVMSPAAIVTWMRLHLTFIRMLPTL